MKVNTVISCLNPLIPPVVLWILADGSRHTVWAHISIISCPSNWCWFWVAEFWNRPSELQEPGWIQFLGRCYGTVHRKAGFHRGTEYTGKLPAGFANTGKVLSHPQLLHRSCASLWEKCSLFPRLKFCPKRTSLVSDIERNAITCKSHSLHAVRHSPRVSWNMKCHAEN